jgi:fatty acid amide hydrolase 2
MMTGLTERPAIELASAIRNRAHSALEVVDAHIECHRRWAPLLGALVANRFKEARADALRADQRVLSAASPEELPPLLGVPFTVKESIALRGMPNSSGLVARRHVRAEQNAPVVQRLIEAGAIPLGVTNTSELTLWIESVNRVYGRTSNPYDQRRTAGGSSGGEGAAVGCGASPFGVGADIAGSIRIPALFCGVFGHKPSVGLVPNEGMYPPASGDANRLLGTGPLARRAEDLMPLLRVMSGPKGSARLGDPGAVSLAGLHVTTVENSSLLPISRELRDARERAVGALCAAGAVVRRVELRSWRRALLPYLVTLQAGAGETTAALFEAAGAAPPGWRSLLQRGGDHTLPTRLTVLGERLPRFEGRLLERMLRAGRELAAELADVIGDGVLLHPAFATVAPPHGRTVGRPWLFKSAAMFNLAGVPVTEVPLGLSANGLPLGVQVAAGLGSDHLSIAVALELQRVFMGWVRPR